MSLDAKIKRLLEQGEYLEADRLADEHKITDCRNICQNLDEINEIANSIERSISLMSTLDEKINAHQSELRNFEDTAFQMEREDDAVKIQGENIRATCALIETLIENLRITDQTREVLLEGNLYDENHAELVEEALKQLESALKFKPDQSLRDIKCVRDQREHAKDVKSKFCDRFYEFFAQFIDALFTEYSESFINHIFSQAITMPGHDVIHNHLLYLAKIVRWIWENDKSTYTALNNFYNARSKTQYDKELKIFFECAKEKMANPSRNHGRLAELTADARKRSSMGASESNTRASSLSGNTLDTQDTVSGKSSEISYTGWDEFDAYIERILHAIDPTCSSEQRFYSAFFPIDQDGGGELTNAKLVEMFKLLENLFNNFADYYNNGLYSLYLLVRLSQYLWEQNNSHLFLMQIYREVLIRVKRNFDTFMKLQLDSIRDMKAPKQSKCGVLSVVKNFEQFAKQVETLFKSTGARRSDIDRWYIELVTELFKAIDKVEHNRTPTEMIRLENYNYLHDVLRSIKVPCLKAKQEEAHLQYKIALDSYVARYFGRPLEKINIFFEGVQAKVAQGVKEEEISFQLAFSKQELRKVLQMVTLKEVRKGLEEMYRRIEKHASEPDSNLIQVIWHAMQTEFVSQYEAIQGLIERCYPSTNSSLTFTIDDVLRVFSDIAQSH